MKYAAKHNLPWEEFENEIIRIGAIHGRTLSQLKHLLPGRSTSAIKARLAPAKRKIGYEKARKTINISPEGSKFGKAKIKLIRLRRLKVKKYPNGAKQYVLDGENVDSRQIMEAAGMMGRGIVGV